MNQFSLDKIRRGGTLYIQIFTQILKYPTKSVEFLSYFLTSPIPISANEEYWQELLNRLARLIEKSFNIEELKILCFQLNIDFDNLGMESKSGKVIELVSLFERKNLVNQLLDACKHQRPYVEWPIIDPLTSTTKNNSQEQLINFKLVLFITANFCIGVPFYGTVVGMVALEASYWTILIVTVGLWFVYSGIVSSVCKGFKGNGTTQQTFGVALQLISVTYVVCTVIASIFTGAVSLFVPPDYWARLFPIYHFIRFLILGIYYLPALKALHEFKWSRAVSVTLFIVIISMSLSVVLSLSPTIPSAHADCIPTHSASYCS